MAVDLMDLPGFEHAINKEILNPPIIFLRGPAGIGKTLYCRQFLSDGLALGGAGIFVSSDMAERQFNSLFSHLPTTKMDQLKFLSLSKLISSGKENWRSVFKEDGASESNQENSAGTNQRLLLLLLERIQELLADLAGSSPTTNTRLVFDSLSYLQQFYGDILVQRFVTALASMLRENCVPAILVISTGSGTNDVQGGLINMLSSLLDGVVEMKSEEGADSAIRAARLASIRGHPSNSSNWVRFRIEQNGMLVFESDRDLVVNCVLCGKAIRGKAIMYNENAFDSNSCLDTYRKLSKIYGSAISPSSGIPSDAVNLHFFFIDIVGLSDPSLSVKRQMDKITVLNSLVKSCQAFKGVSRDKKIVLPTGDGMAIGFLLNAELPLQLSIQLHKMLQAHNELKKPEDKLGVRIGISSGNVFIHNDINENQNVWGPGIILARRVMDLGDNLHILVEGNMAKGLMDLKDEYRMYLKELADYKIKHGQNIKIFSAYSKDFGNSSRPIKLEQVGHG